MPDISVILPVYNRLAFLRECVASVRAQSAQDWELVIADDGSDAATRAWLADLGDPRMRVLTLAHRGSPALARNAAIAAARGTYLAFLDSDDLWTPDKLARQRDALRARPGCRWSYTGFTRIGPDGAELAAHARNAPPADGWIFEAVLRGTALIRTPAVMVERALIEQVGAFDADIRACEDFDLWLRLALVSPAASLDAPLLRVRVAPGSYSDRWPHALEDRGRALRNLLARVEPERRGLVRAECARNSAALAAEYFDVGRDADGRRERRACLRAALRHPSAWRAALRMLLHARLPRARGPAAT